LQHCSPRGLSDNSKWMDYSPEGKQCDIEIPVYRTMRQSGEAFSTHTTLQKCEPTFGIGCQWRGVARTKAGSRIQPSVPWYDAKSGCHCDEAFSLLT